MSTTPADEGRVEGAQADEGPADEGPAEHAQADEAPAGRRRRRRATGGVPSSVEPDGLLPGRSRDDTDTGWGERPPADDDERYLRDVPPHW